MEFEQSLSSPPNDFIISLARSLVLSSSSLSEEDLLF